MGDLRVCYTNANADVSGEERLFHSLPFSLSLHPDEPCSITRESWERAEEISRRIVWSIRPTLGADRERKEVLEYVQRLIQDGLGYQVFPYGSVPLKTYLPDGDIDLTTLSSPPVGDTSVSDVYAILRDEEHNQKAPYKVKDVHFIDAEVKLVKCLVQNIVVDISFNQLGGLCALCFLEQVDRLVDKDHLFKCSIILIKAWCYYESRILGAHHGLISTYALEILVLYVFHLFHSSLNSPISVLYRFLDYFSKFDWENYCISLNGPVCKSSLPAIVAEIPENVGNDPLLSEEFLRKCTNMFSVPSRGAETSSPLFPLKHLNIIDPLKENNNLGRSVNRGNFYRIRSAFKYGARKLGQILTLPRERIADELVKFFANTLQRHGSSRLIGRNPTSDVRGSDHVLPLGFSSICPGNYLFAKTKNFVSSIDKISGSIAASGFKYKLECPFNVLSSQVMPERQSNSNRNAVSGYCHPGDAKEFVVSGSLARKSRNDSSDNFPVSGDLGASLSVKPQVNKPNGRIENGNSSKSLLTDSVGASDIRFVLKPYSKNIQAASHDVCEEKFTGNFGDSESLKSLLDLSGDYDCHFWNVLYGQYCHLFSVSTPILPSAPVLQKENHWETFEQSIPLKQDLYSQGASNGILRSENCFSKLPGAVCLAFDSENKKKQGTGAYTFNLKCRSYQERLSYGRVDFQASRTHSMFQRYTNNGGPATAQQEMSLFQEGNHELSQEEYPALGPLKFGSSNTHRGHQSVWCLSAADVLSCLSERFESGSCNLELQCTHMSEDNALLVSSARCSCSSIPSAMIPAAQSGRPVVESHEERDAGQSYHLKNEHDFPPLSV